MTNSASDHPTDPVGRAVAVTADLTVSFQRFPYPPDGRVSTLPTSRGALPLLIVGRREILLPSPEREAFWIGLVAAAGSSSSVDVTVILHSDARMHLETVHCPPTFALEGIPRENGTWWVFARNAAYRGSPACSALKLVVTPAPPATGNDVTLRATVVEPTDFEHASGQPVPPLLGENDTYRGWRLP